ncbi:MAG: hypothetical protein K0R57_1395 [Paenibacillaceae bacterium]|nr:hypothetical protein [Paenibacillaceae bacterium]
MKRKGTHARRIVPAAIAVSMLGTLLAACQSDDTKEAVNTPAGGTSAASSPSTPSAVRTKLTVAVTANPNVEDYETNYFTKLVEKEMNVDLDFVVLPSNANEAKTKLSLMISSGQTLPDVINFYLDTTTLNDYAAKGVIMKLDDYYKNPSLAVNFNKIPEKDFLFKKLQLADGNVYSLPKYVKQEWNEGPNRAWINGEWLEKLNLETPTTTEELYQVMKAFAEKDPNGNNKKDEIGMVGSKDGWAQRPLVYLMNSFIEANPDRAFFYMKDGKVTPAFTQPEWKQGLEYMNKLVKEGLLSPLSFTQDQTQMKALINVKGGMVGIVPSGSYSAFDPVITENKMTLLAPVKGPQGIAYSPRNETLPDKLWVVTKNAKNPELAFKVGDYMLGAEPSMVNRYGEKGVDWSDDPAIAAQYVGEFDESEGIKAKYAVLNPKIWNNPQNKHWNQMSPAYAPPEVSKAVASLKKGDTNASPNWQPPYAKLYVPFFPKNPMPALSFNSEELKKIANNKTSIDLYVNESAVAFITGNKPLSQWDSYLKELTKMGLDEYIATSQTALDRTK